ncbi:hypothetical protein F5X96DRAFT_636728 [Biscogniauxia mediterranea]|nr:hypothetical protein F5X96DRAFT_636728 [Biscogniauxia mediterranea]
MPSCPAHLPYAMRLVCELDNGDLLDIRSAVKQDPYQLRGVLIDALLLCHREALHDTISVLRVEHSLRTTLDEFSGIQEKYVRSYVLSRKLDHRTQVTARAPLIASALQIGGPLALIAVFYATLDAHRNSQSRITLDLLINDGISEDSKRDLFKRANHFPVNPSFTGWFNRLLDKLDLDSLGVACLLYCLGADEIPQFIFSRSRGVSKTWDRNGEVWETKPTIASLVQEASAFDAALRKLEMLGFARSTANVVRVNRRLASILKDREENLAWKVKATQLVMHALPRHRVLEPANYNIYFETMLPHLSHVFSYLVEPQVLALFIQGPDPILYGAIEVCLASSYFGDDEWKSKAIAMAERLVQAYAGNNGDPSDIALFNARLRMRRIRFCFSQSAGSMSEELALIDFPSIKDARSNAFSADLAVLKALECIRRDDLPSAHAALSQFTPLFASTFEKSQKEVIEPIYGMVYRFQGRFHEAYDVLSTVRSPSSKTLAHLAAVMCELGEESRAIPRLEAWLRLYAQPDTRAGARIRLALTNAHLTGGIRQLLSGKAWHGCQETQSMYQELETSGRLGWMDRISVALGIAITEHVGKQPGSAIQKWQDVRNLTRQFQLPFGYTDVIVDLSICELEASLGRLQEIEVMRARDALMNVRCQFYFTLLGPVWLGLLKQWLQPNGRQQA